MSGVGSVERPPAPCSESDAILAVFGHHRHMQQHINATMLIFTDDDSDRETELAIKRQGAPYASSSSDRSSNSATENSVNTWFSDKNIICDARSTLSLARFLANIRPHFEQLRSDAHAVVCMDKSMFAITANFGKAEIYLVHGVYGVYPNIGRLIRVRIFGQYTLNIRSVHGI